MYIYRVSGAGGAEIVAATTATNAIRAAATALRVTQRSLVATRYALDHNLWMEVDPVPGPGSFLPTGYHVEQDGARSLIVATAKAWAAFYAIVMQQAGVNAMTMWKVGG